MILILLLGACRSDAQNTDVVMDEAQLDALLAQTYETASGDSLDLLPGRFREAFLDLPEVLEYGIVRVLVSATRTNYLMSASFKHGFEYELMREYEKELNAKAPGRFVMVFLPVPFELLLPALVAGRGDIVAAGLTVTPERQKLVAFTDPYIKDVSVVVVGQKAGPDIGLLTDLGGKEVTVVRGSVFERQLVRLNETLLSGSGLDPVIVNRAPPYMEVEDLLELVNDGLIDYTVADDHVARLWSSVLDGIEIYNESPLQEGGQIAWAVRKESPKLKESLSAFARKNQKGSLLGNVLFKRYFEDTGWLTGVRSSVPQDIELMRGLVQKYAKEYDFDWLLLAAVAHQESKLNHETRSGAGAVGLFQIKPGVASQEVGVDDVESVEGNILAGIRYLDHLRKTYLNDPSLTEVQRSDLTLASYNAGPNRVKQLRKKAAEQGYDPNTWFGNVERFAPRETRNYVANINRLYYAFKLGWTLREKRQEEKGKLK